MQNLRALAAAIAASLMFQPAAAEPVMVVPQGVVAPADYQLIADYGSYRLFRGPAESAPAGAWQLDQAGHLAFDREAIDTARAAPEPPAGFSLSMPDGAALQIVQFVGPIKDAWLDAVRATGAVPIQYIESNGYLLWADSAARARLATMAAAGSPLQYSQPLPGFVKLGKSLFERLNAGSTGTASIPIIVQRYRHDDGESGRERFSADGLKPLNDWTPQLGYEIARFSATPAQIRQIVEWPDVSWVGEYFEPTLDDEVQAQIIRGRLTADQSGPVEPGYLTWLGLLGFPTDPNAYPILDITDSGIGDTTTMTGDPTLHAFGDAALASRMVYNQACTLNNGPVDGHGHINANIALGYDVRDNASTPGARFPAEYQRGQGMNPFGRLGGTRVFAPGFDQSACGGSYTGVIEASYAAGARISSNSWGCAPCAAQYDISSQAYDAAIRDADPLAAGNQELITIFSAGNAGSAPGTIGAPGNGKNMITVGASETPRPVDENGTWFDGCQIGANGADNAMDVIFFSSRGPAPGNRIKPDLIAPGTHVAGTRAVDSTGTGICDATRPLGNATFAASSGTSHSTPAVSGVASLSWWWIANGQGSLDFDAAAPAQPSPALMKAWLVAHPTYLTGVDANDTLPSNAQGYGMPNLEAMFSDTPNWLLDQTRIFGDSGETWSGQFQAAFPGRPVRIVLAWTDAPGVVGVSPQVNNLDLEVSQGANLFRGNRFDGQWNVPGGEPDTRNNLEAVSLTAGSAGTFTVQVRAFNVAGDGVPGNADATDQDFALVCSNCAKGPTFALGLKPDRQSACTIETPSLPLMVSAAPILGFDVPLALSVDAAPPGTSTVFSSNPMPVTATSTLSIGNLTSAPAGSYTLSVSAEAAGIRRTRYARLDLYSAVPSNFTLLQPALGAGNVDLQPYLQWQASTQAARYRLEVARDADFNDIVYATETEASSHQVASALDYATTYYWRVTAENDCGERTAATSSSFTTAPVPGECPLGAQATAVYATDFEDGSGAWSVSGSHNTWSITSARTHSGSLAYRAEDLPFVSDQRLSSPVITLPLGQAPLILSFWSHQTLEDRIGGCYDGVLLEVSTDFGASWLQVPDANMYAGRYDGPISTSFNNPARGKQAWCGDPHDWTRSLVGLDAYAGQTVRLRFRLASDASTGRVPDGFYLDDFLIQSCVGSGDAVFANGFD